MERRREQSKSASAVLRRVPLTVPAYASGGLYAAARAKPPSAKYVQGGGAQLHADFVGDERDQRSQLKWMHLWLSECARNRRPATPAVFMGLFRCMPAGALEAWLHWRGRRFAADCLPCESLRQRYPDGTARGSASPDVLTAIFDVTSGKR